MEGGVGGPLIKDSWEWQGREDELRKIIHDGLPDLGMQPFADVLSDAEIRALIVLLREQQLRAIQQEKPAPVIDSGDVHESELHSFTVESVVDGLRIPWSFAFLPGGSDTDMLITERPGTLRQYIDGELMEPVAGTPAAWAHGQGGMLDVVLHPDYAENRWVYLAFSETQGEQGGRPVGMTAIVRGRIQDNVWQDEEEIYRAPAEFHTRSGGHFGTRIVLHDGMMFFAVGDRGSMNQAQDLSRPNGKIHRLHDDGRIPADNPFVNVEDALPSIWCYGNRNPQGLALDPRTGKLWESEHGPRGGDEINLIKPGRNYGWPVISHGIHYNGRPITDITEAPGMEQPALHWTPSISVCGMDFYTGDLFPEWKYNLIVGGLASQQLHRLVIEGDTVVSDEILLRGIGRIRHVRNGPDGAIYLALNSPDKIVRIRREN